MRGLNTRNSKLTDSYIKQFDEATVSSLLLRKAENVSFVLLDDFAIFLAVSFGTSQNNSSHQVTSKRQIIQYCTFGAVNYSDCSRE